MVINVTESRPASRPGPGPEHGVIVAEGLVKTYPGEVHAVRGISFSVAAGESFGLLGPNGAGKSTTIGMLNTTIRPTSGRALLADHDVQADPMGARRVTSVVFQDPVLDRPLTGRQNLQLHLRLWRVPKAEGLARLAGLTAAVGLADLLDRPPGRPVIRRSPMKFLCLAYPGPGFTPGPGLVAEYAALGEAMRAAGVFIDSGQLSPVSAAKLVRVTAGQADVSDGPMNWSGS